MANDRFRAVNVGSSFSTVQYLSVVGGPVSEGGTVQHACYSCIIAPEDISTSSFPSSAIVLHTNNACPPRFFSFVLPLNAQEWSGG
jgi:hypothetical protein